MYSAIDEAEMLFCGNFDLIQDLSSKTFFVNLKSNFALKSSKSHTLLKSVTALIAIPHTSGL